MQPAIQLYSLRNVDESILSIVDRVGETSFEGVEFATRADEAPPEEIVAHLEEAGLEAVSAHVGIDLLEDDLEGVVERANALGYDDVVVPWLDPDHFASVAAVEDAAERLSAIAERLSDEGMRLHYHNHDQEFAETEQGVAFHVLAQQAPDVGLQVDAGWAMAAGVDPADLIHQYAERITLVHLKDAQADTSATDDLDDDAIPALGEGDLDLEGVADASRNAGAEWLIFENDEPVDPLAELESASEILSRLV